MDQSIQKGSRKGVDSGELNINGELLNFMWFKFVYYIYLLYTHTLIQHFFLFQDNSLEFEKRRNIPVKYNRGLWDKTGIVKIISRIYFSKKIFFSFFELTGCVWLLCLQWKPWREWRKLDGNDRQDLSWTGEKVIHTFEFISQWLAGFELSNLLLIEWNEPEVV